MTTAVMKERKNLAVMLDGRVVEYYKSGASLYVMREDGKQIFIKSHRKLEVMIQVLEVFD